VLPRDADGRLRPSCRHKLATAFHNQWRRTVRWRGKPHTPARILEIQAGDIKKAFLGSDGYRAFRFQW
jgi:hypothetical protein